MSFNPTAEQIAFRDHARKCVDEDNVMLVGQWCRSSDGVTVSDWNAWSEAEGFMGWWNTAFPEHAGVTAADIVMIDYQGHVALADGLRKRDSRAIQTWGALKRARDAATEVNQDEKREAIRRLLESDPANNPEAMTGWYTGPTGQAR